MISFFHEVSEIECDPCQHNFQNKKEIELINLFFKLTCFDHKILIRTDKMKVTDIKLIECDEMTF